tara:strand:- start:120 stop:503 length:384 start_codon:yes stop_codon:yes gene_type:complete
MVASGVKHHAADTVSSAGDLPCYTSGQFRSSNRFQALLTAKKHMLALVDKDQGRTLAFFPKHLRVWCVFSRSNSPIDAAYVVAGLVLPHFSKVDAAAFVFGKPQTCMRASNLARWPRSTGDGAKTQG